jgi:hypothetical protein
LEKLESEQGVWFQGAPSVLENTVSVQFKDLTFQEGLQRILSNMNYALFFEGGSKLVGIFVIGNKGGQGGSVPRGMAGAENRQSGETVKKGSPLKNPFGIPMAGRPNSQKSPPDAIFGKGALPVPGQDSDNAGSPFSQNPFSGNPLPEDNPFGQHASSQGENAPATAFGNPFSPRNSSQAVPEDTSQDSAESPSPFSPQDPQ